MKGLVILAIVLGLLGAGIWMGIVRTSLSDQGTWFIVAAGDPKDDAIDWVVSVDMEHVRREGPKVDRQFNPLWEEWIEDHFQMHNAAGEKMPFTRIAHTLLVDENKVKHIPEFYIKYKLKKGQPYTLDYTPTTQKPTQHRHEFTAPSEQLKPKRVRFLPVKK